jgi:VWFA-related protein
MLCSCSARLAASLFSLLPAVVVSTPALVHDQGQSPRTRDVYVSVVDAKGAPVTDLTAADFTVREDGVAREVLKVSRADKPLQIALLIDDSAVSEPAIQRVREGVQAFVDALAGKADIQLMEIGDRPNVLVDYTPSADALKRGIGRLFARAGSGAYLLEAILDASRSLRSREAARPVIVALTFESATEFSNEHYQQVLDDIEKTGAALHVLAVGTPNASNTDEMRNRNQVIAAGTQQTGGRRDQLLSELSIPDKMKQLALELSSQLVLTYARPETLIPPEKLAGSVTRPGLTARARTRVTGR